MKYTESRSESLVSAHHGRDVIQDIELTAKRDGTVLGLHVNLIANMGAYLGLVGPGVPILGAFMYNAIYKFKAYRFECTGVFTNTTFTDAYRGAGRPEATYAIERVMDELAVELGMDPIEVRRKNWINTEEFPFKTVAGLEYDSGDYEAATTRALSLLGYDELRREQEARRASGDTVQLGIGVSTYTEMCGLAPSRVLGALRYGAGGWESASIRMLPTGKVEVVTGTSPHGQGHETAWSQIVADQLGVPFDDVEVLHGDTRTSYKGLDTYGSRSLAVGGIALYNACQKVVEKAKPIAAHMLECDPADLEFTEGKFRVRGNPDGGKTMADCALAVFAAHDLPDGIEPTLDADAVYDPVNFSFPHGTHLCAVEVDTETGACEDPVLRGRRRHRQGRQPADRRGSGARRRGSGHRAGAVRGGRLRRRRKPDERYVRRLHAADGGGPAELRHRPHGEPGAGPSAGHQGRRRGGDDRLDAGRGQRDRRRAAPVRCFRHRDAVHARAGVAGHPRRFCWRCRMIPSAFDYAAPSSVDEAVAALSAGGEDAKVLAGGQSLIPLAAAAVRRAERPGRPRSDRRAAGHPRRR